MPPHIYYSVKAEIHRILREHFLHVGTPIEAPQKEDFGDIDVIVACPVDEFLDQMGNVLHRNALLAKPVKALGAHQWEFEVGQPKCTLALRWPQSDLSTTTNSASTQNCIFQEERFIQVDLTLADSEEDFKWRVFQHSHGDLWPILSSTITFPLGLHISNAGFFVRIAEIEMENKKRSMVLLSKDPGRILDFLGLEGDTFWKEGGFEDMDALFGYIFSCRFWGRVCRNSKTEEPEGKIENKVMKRRDRKRLEKRAVYKAFMDEFGPEAYAKEGAERVVSRGQLLEEILDVFQARKEYEKRLKEWREEQLEMEKKKREKEWRRQEHLRRFGKGKHRHFNGT